MFETKNKIQLVTNFSNSELHIYQLAVNTYNKRKGKSILFISNIAKYGENNERIYEHGSSLNIVQDVDLSDFWDMFHEFQSTIEKFNS